MRAVYVPRENWDSFYSKQVGQGLPGFEGVAFQRGGGLGNFLGRLFRFILPVAKKVGKAVGKQALASGAEIISDAAQGKNFKESVKKRGRAGAGQLADKVGKNMRGGGAIGKRPNTIKANKRKQKNSYPAVKRARGFYGDVKTY